MDTSALKTFARDARRALRDQVTAKLDLVLAEGSAARREAPGAVAKLQAAIGDASRDQVVEKVAYTWFNRFSALRFMDANGYTGVRVLSPREGETRPEILSEAMAGVFGAETPTTTADKVRALLDGRAPSRDPQGEAYRLLVVAACNHWHGPMPFLFEPIADETELLMPDDLLSASSVPAKLCAVMTDEACRDVEIIGWLYQFYISEKKDEVFAALKKNVKITPENIPAATQLFTPHWIVRYLVENSLGRLWLLNRPRSKLAARMDYYIAPVEPETDYLRVSRPEEIRVCDPACGSGHMLTYAFDLLYAIYEEEGFDAAEIPALILTHNLQGIEIDDRAGALAAFALAMKAAAKLGRRRFLRLAVKPNICVLQNVRFTPAEMQDVATMVGHDLFTGDLRETLGQFDQAKNFGSLIMPKLRDPAEVARFVRMKDFGGDLLRREVQERVLAVLIMAEALAPKYHVVVANPPYKSKSDLNKRLADFIETNYPIGKTDLYAAFMLRALHQIINRGKAALVTMQNWLFVDSQGDIRKFLLSNCRIERLVQIGFNSFPEMNSKVALAAAFVLGNAYEIRPGYYINLNDAHQSCDKGQLYLDRTRSGCNFYRPKAIDMRELPSSMIAYAFSERLMRVYKTSTLLSEYFFSDGLTKTGNNDEYLRQNWEIAKIKAWDKELYRRCAKGGETRSYYGNCNTAIKWGILQRNHYITDPVARISPEYLWSHIGITWTKISTKTSSFRILVPGTIAETGGPTIFLRDAGSEAHINAALGFLSSRVAKNILAFICPSVNFQTSDILNLPFIVIGEDCVAYMIAISQSDWDSQEVSWDFTTLPILSSDYRAKTLATTYARLRSHWQSMTEEMQQLEEENNRIFIDAYGLQDELEPEVPRNEITLTCNPAYRYGGGASEEALESRLRADTMVEFLSYAVGCMFGRFSLDASGPILADQGDTLETYLAKIPNPSFTPSADNVIPMLDGDWFADDVTERFRQFLRLTFGEPHFAENLAFIEDALGKDIRRYFVRDFFNDHVKRYKKRPIYWLFSSPLGTFNALIYMHRYTPDTVGVLLNEYLRPFRSRLEARRIDQQRLAIDPAATPAQRAKADKEIQSIEKAIVEIDAWERDVIYPLAARRIEIDLDDGVKANYPKFAGALKPIKGLEEAED